MYILIVNVIFICILEEVPGVARETSSSITSDPATYCIADNHTPASVVVVVFIFNMACEQSINLVDTYVIHSVFSNYID